MPRYFLCYLSNQQHILSWRTKLPFILGVTTLLHMRLGESLLRACEMPKVKPPMRFLPEPWTSLAYIPKSFRGNPFGTHLGCQVPDGELCMGPHILWVQGARKALYQRVLPHDGPSNTVWSLPLLTSAWPGFAHTSLGRQTSRCRGGHQCAFLLIAVFLPTTPPVMEKAGGWYPGWLWHQSKHSISHLTTHPSPL